MAASQPSAALRPDLKRVLAHVPLHAAGVILKYAQQARDIYAHIPDCVHPHMFRRPKATELCRDGVNPAIVSRFPGHAQLETTRIYTAPVETMRKSIESIPADSTSEQPIWRADADEIIAKLYGLR